MFFAHITPTRPRRTSTSCSFSSLLSVASQARSHPLVMTSLSSLSSIFSKQSQDRAAFTAGSRTSHAFREVTLARRSCSRRSLLTRSTKKGTRLLAKTGKNRSLSVWTGYTMLSGNTGRWKRGEGRYNSFGPECLSLKSLHQDLVVAVAKE